MQDSKARLLIVDDTPAGRQLLQVLLSDDPYQLYCVGTGREALEQLSQVQPDLILMDVLMPGMDGFEVCRRIRESPYYAEVPIFLITALDDQASRLKGLDSGADEFISKPLNSTELRSRVRNVLRLNRFGRLRAERERYAQLFQHSPDALLIVGRDGTVLGANDAAARLLEAPYADRALGLDLGSRLEESSRPMLQYLLAAIDDPKARPGQSELRLGASHKGPRLLEVWHAPLIWGSVPALQLIARDVTDLRQLADEYRHLQRLDTVGQLTAGLAHDFSNVLSIINAYSSLLLSTVAEDDPHRRGIQSISDAAERATQMASQVLHFSRKLQYSPRVLDLNAQLTELEPLLQRLVGDTVEIQVEPSMTLEPVFADPCHLEQIILNLAANARDALPKGGLLTLLTGNELAPSTAPENFPRFIFLRVLDNGCGMDNETRQRIFEPFFTTKGEAGTGLGLTNVLRIVKEHHGFIRVESIPGRGTEITLYLPVAHGLPLPEAAYIGRDGEPRLILIVWPDPLERIYLADILQTYGYRTLAAETSQATAALAAEEARRLSLVIAGNADAKLAAALKQAGCEVPLVHLGSGQPASPGHLLRKVADALLPVPTARLTAPALLGLQASPR